jgi:hypothetical protein
VERLEPFDRAVVSGAVVLAALLTAMVLAPWTIRGSGRWSSSLERGDQVAWHGWLVLLAALSAAGLAFLTSRSRLARAGVLLAGMFAAGQALATRNAITGVCPDIGGDGPSIQHTLGLLCSSASIGWGLQLATVAALGLFCAGVLLSASALGPLVRSQQRPVRETIKKYGR